MTHSNSLKVEEYSNQILTERFHRVAVNERHATADLIAHLREFSKRRLYLEEGHASIFAYMTKVLGYSEPTAQNRIDAARFVESVPDLLTDLYSGQINLTQISLLAQSVRQKENESIGEKVSDEKKSDLVSKIKGLDSKSSAVIVARELDLTLKTRERLRYQKDESVILEVTLSKQQIEQLRRIRELNSHRNHDANWSDIISLAAGFYLSKKDPAGEKLGGEKPDGENSKGGTGPVPALGPAPTEKSRGTAPAKSSERLKPERSRNQSRKAISRAMRTAVLARDKCCQFMNEKTGTKCESTFQLQVDHIHPVWANGTNVLENLQALCGVHNRYKYLIGH